MKLKSQDSLHFLLTITWKWNDGRKGKAKKLICIWPNGLFPQKKGKTINNWQTPTHKNNETCRRKRRASIGSKTCAQSICNPPKWVSKVKVYLSSTKKDASKNSSSLSEEEAGAWISSAIATAKKKSCKLQMFRPSYWSLPAKFNLNFGVLESCWFRDWG